MLKTPQQLADEARKEIEEVQIADVRKRVDTGDKTGLLIDVREPNEHAQGMIPGALALPRGLLEVQMGRVTQDENLPITCYCGGGTRSLFAAQQLKRMGFTNVKSMAGGFGAWSKGGNPVAMPKT